MFPRHTPCDNIYLNSHLFLNVFEDNKHPKLCVPGWEDGSPGKWLAVQPQGPEFEPQNLCKKSQAWCPVLVISTVGRWTQVDSSTLLVCQLKLIGESRPVRDPVFMSQKHKVDSTQRMPAEVHPWPPHSSTHGHLAHTYTQRHVANNNYNPFNV